MTGKIEELEVPGWPPRLGVIQIHEDHEQLYARIINTFRLEIIIISLAYE